MKNAYSVLFFAIGLLISVESVAKDHRCWAYLDGDACVCPVDQVSPHLVEILEPSPSNHENWEVFDQVALTGPTGTITTYLGRFGDGGLTKENFYKLEFLCNNYINKIKNPNYDFKCSDPIMGQEIRATDNVDGATMNVLRAKRPRNDEIASAQCLKIHAVKADIAARTLVCGEKWAKPQIKTVDDITGAFGIQCN